MVLDSTIIVGVLSLIGTLIGSLSGIFAANKLTTYRICLLYTSDAADE